MIVDVNPDTFASVESAIARILYKTGWELVIESNVLTFKQRFEGGTNIDGAWTIPTLGIDKLQTIALTYDSDSAANDPVIYIDGVSQTVTETSTPDATRTSDAANNLIVGNLDAGNRTFNGTISDVRIYDEALSASEIYNIANPLTPFKFITEIRN